ncbi:hypothetical protein [Paludibacterium denitrificans]|uniref:Uncharacterized protein n=1 Tax=Paludibacterium denitrificans TaxID=2675226 RepID=A0A844GCV7_9NEIS|nr:hypothetical protein [Paludibacterium denitrificans]MTD32425.1 hypothetical protein [Paludibacterium denitrificans]
MSTGYKLTTTPDMVIRLDDGASIPRGHRWWDDYEAWLAEGNTPEAQTADDVAAERNAVIKQQLSELDGKSVRSLHEAMLALAESGTALPSDITKRLQDLEAQKQALREQLV